VHGIRLIAAHHRIERLQPFGVCAQVGEHYLAGRCRRRKRRLVCRLGQPVGQRPFQLGRPSCPAETVAAEQFISCLKQLPAAAGQFHFDLVPLGHARCAAQGLGGDIVRRHLGERLAGPVEQDQALPLGRHPGDWLERLATGVHAHQFGQLAGHLPPGPAERQPDLAAGIGADRQLQVPSGVIAATATAQRNARADQPQVIGVVVVGLELLPSWPGGPGNLPQAVQAGQGCTGMRLVLGLGFVRIHCHTGLLPPAGRAIRFLVIHCENRGRRSSGSANHRPAKEADS
jgi:hypothetical protein